MAQVFVSYSRKDRDFVCKLNDALVAQKRDAANFKLTKQHRAEVSSRDSQTGFLVTSVAGSSALAAPSAETCCFVDVSVVPMDKPSVLAHQTVIVSNGHIKQVGSVDVVKISGNATSINGRGKYLMPGLADMHVHFIRSAIKAETPSATTSDSAPQPGIPASTSSDHEFENEAYGLLFVASGVTAVRNMWGESAVDDFAKLVNSGRAIGPHIYSTGPITDGNPPVWKSSRVVETQLQAEQAVKQDKDSGHVALKVYNNLSSDSYNSLVTAARAAGLPIVGHVPSAVGLQRVVAAGQYSIEHLGGFLEALQSESGANSDASMQQLLDGVDLGKLPALVDSIRTAGVWSCPTLTVYQPYRQDAEWHREATFLPPTIIDRYHSMYPDWDPSGELTRRWLQLNISITRALHQGGAHLLLGTDAAKANVLPGFSLREEIKYFVDAGLSPYEALRAGTSDAAIFLHQENEFGVVAMGYRADLLLLEANPLDDVANVSKRVGVMVNGSWFPEAELQKRLSALKDSYQHRRAP